MAERDAETKRETKCEVFEALLQGLQRMPQNAEYIVDESTEAESRRERAELLRRQATPVVEVAGFTRRAAARPRTVGGCRLAASGSSTASNRP